MPGLEMHYLVLLLYCGEFVSVFIHVIHRFSFIVNTEIKFSGNK